jgi:hypothetical protein
VKQNITLAIEKSLLQHAKAIAAQRGTSISGLLAEELEKLVRRDEAYRQAKRRALIHLNSPFHLGGAEVGNREALHDRQSLR